VNALELLVSALRSGSDIPLLRRTYNRQTNDTFLLCEDWDFPSDFATMVKNIRSDQSWRP
jgi:hypothetical protein